MIMMRNATTLSKIVMMIFISFLSEPLHILMSQLLSSSLYQHNAILKDAAHIKEPQNASLC